MGYSWDIPRNVKAITEFDLFGYTYRMRTFWNSMRDKFDRREIGSNPDYAEKITSKQFETCYKYFKNKKPENDRNSKIP